MSLRSKKSAFAVFSKSRKATSLSNMSIEGTPKQTLGKRSKSASANTTPISGSSSSRENSLTSSASGNSGKKKKLDAKKIKKLLKSATKKRPSILPDQSMQSPLFPNISTNGVELRSMRPKKSVTGSAFPFPLKATPDSPVPQLQWVEEESDVSKQFSLLRNRAQSTTPPLPPKARVVKAVKPIPNECKTDTSTKRASQLADTSSHVPDVPPRPHHPITQSTPPRPAKRRRVSEGSGSQSPVRTMKDSSFLSPGGSRERMEAVPRHPQEKRVPQPYMYDSREEARRLFECLIHPVIPDKFFSELWEKKPLLVKRHQPEYNDGWFNTSELDRIMREEPIKFSENLDVVSYENGKRETHNPDGRAHAAVVWDYYQNGCSVRLLNPQTYSRNVWKLLSILQEYFGCCVGANVYLTPPCTQGFAPHWDDIEAFILQLEGKKHWRLYSPRQENEALPRHSSNNFSDVDIGEPILDVILEAGDLLYFPRGTIHQGKTMEEHSLHITVSCYQKNTWGDVMEKLIPQALQIALDEDIEFRKALPKDYLNHMGVAFSEKDCPERQNFLRHIEQLMHKLISYAPVDASCDQMGKKYIEDSLPPVLTEAEKFCSIYGQGERWDRSERRVVRSVELEPDTDIKLIRGGCARLITEEDKVFIYHNLENARVYHGNELQSVEITAEMAPAVEYLIHAYPDFVTIDSLPLDEIQDKVQLISTMYDKGLIVTHEPLEPASEESECDNTEPLPTSSRKKSVL